MVVFLQALDESIDPKIYADRGNGFTEAGAISPRHAGTCIYSITVSAPYRVARIRIDPRASEGRFRYWAKAAWNESDLAALLQQAREDAAGAVSVFDIVIDGTPEKRKRRNRNKNIAEHFASVVRLAERTAPPIDPSMMTNAPFISFVVPVYNTPERYLDDLLASFRAQPAGSAELILCEDGSTSPQTLAWLARHENARDVRIVLNESNAGIAAATSSGIAVARGEWISFIDHDDALSLGAVQLIAHTARQYPDCKFIYTDEVVTDAKLKPIIYFLKPAYDEVLLSGVNYINHLSCYRRDRLIALGGLRAGYDGSQDYDLLLRYLCDLKPNEVKHLPYPAYQWRRSPSAFSARFMEQATRNARRALAERYHRGGAEPRVDEALTKTLHRVRFDQLMKAKASLPKLAWPRVSIVIPNRDSLSLISRLLADLQNRTSYPGFEIIVVDNGTTDRRVLDLYMKCNESTIPFKCEIEPAPFNFSRQVNRGIALASGELILLLNNDIEAIEGDWLREMVSCFSYPETGIVGARLLYPSRRIQHAGVIVGLGGLAGHWFNGQRESYPGPMARLHVRQSVTAVTGACMLISRACLAKVGGFDEDAFAVAYNDIDFCLRAASSGFRVILTPFATLIHHESATRGSDETPANRDRFQRDKDSLRRRHNTETFEDRAYSPWYARDSSEAQPILLARLPEAR
ncbi:MAG: glycosyltransferase family 2 protein [Xanthobacteraceae bacterium]|jgi:GT2 family glycosyltransferase